MLPFKFDLIDQGDLPDACESGGYVYLIGDLTHTKIGKTRQPKVRIRGIIRELGISNPTVYLSQRHEMYSFNEKALHGIYGKYRSHGEWFCITANNINHEFPDLDLDFNGFIAPKNNINSTTVRVYERTSKMVDDLLHSINLKRAKKGLMKLTKTHAIDLAARKLTMKDGMK